MDEFCQRDQFPRAVFLLKKQAHCVNNAMAGHNIHELFNLPLSVEAFQQWQILQVEISELILTDEKDKWTFIWGNSNFSSSKAYKALSGHSQVHPIFKWIWKTSCQAKHKIFFWEVLQDRLSTRNIIRRRGMHLDDFSCAIYQQGLEETVSHLLFYCPFAKDCWVSLNFSYDDNLHTPQIYQAWKNQKQFTFSLDIFILGCWGIWMARNDLIFRNKPPRVPSFRLLLKEEASLLLHRCKASLSQSLNSWISANL